LVCIENTTNKGGGACYDLEELKKIKVVCDQHGLGLHLDGARLFNAIVAKNEDPKVYGKLFDTISICFSKGLGIPLGTILLGNNDLMKNAIRIRKILGGGMRQVGYIAAAGLYAIDNNIERLADDHQRASEIAAMLSGLSFVKKVEPTETNIVIFNLQEDISEKRFIEDMSKKNIRLSDMGEGKLRIVTHLDYTQEMHLKLMRTLENYQ
jgi:threonine aldolase